jgi:hypothetical protein
MAFITIPPSWLDVGDPTKKELFDRIKDDLDDLDSRVGGTEAALSNETPIQFEIQGGYWRRSVPITNAATIIRIPFNITLTSAILFLEDDGTAGTLDVDITYKRGAGAWTTIFSVRPSIAFGGGAMSTTSGTLSVTNLDAADLLKLDIITAMTDNEKFKVYLTWEIRL